MREMTQETRDQNMSRLVARTQAAYDALSNRNPWKLNTLELIANYYQHADILNQTRDSN